MKTILVPIEDGVFPTGVLETSLQIGNLFGSYIEGRCVSLAYPDLSVSLGAQYPELIQGLNEKIAKQVHHGRQQFYDFMEKQGVMRSTGDAPSPKPTVGCEEEIVPGYSALGAIGRLFDLMVVGRPVRGQDQPTLALVENALFESGRPVLVAAPKHLPTFGETVVVVWNGSVEAARTTALAMPILSLAKNVTVLEISDNVVPGPSATEACRHLRRNGIEAQSLEVVREGRSSGQAVLEAAGDLGADLLIKGAFTRSRMRQVVFGGTTKHILEQSDIPVFMAH